jgi:hypothetical protein
MTGTQRFVREVAEMLRPGAGSAVMRAAYDAGEVPRSASLELAAYYGLADRATGWAGAALRKLGLSDYADFLAARPIVDAYGAEEAEQVLRNARFILENELGGDSEGLEPRGTDSRPAGRTSTGAPRNGCRRSSIRRRNVVRALRRNASTLAGPVSKALSTPKTPSGLSICSSIPPFLRSVAVPRTCCTTSICS